MHPIRTVLQVPKEESSTGFFIIWAQDPTPPHPSGNIESWDYIVLEYDPARPEWRGKERRLTEGKLQSMLLRNGVVSA